MSNNYTHIADVINSGGLDSDNYGASAIESTHIAVSQIISSHLANNCVVSQKFTDGAIVAKHVNYASSDGGVQVLRVGSASQPTNGCEMVRVTKSFGVTNSGGLQPQKDFTFSWSEAVDGNPSFTATPVIMGMPMIEMPTSNPVRWARNWANYISSIDSDGMTFTVKSGNPWVVVFTETVTMHVVAMGAASD